MVTLETAISGLHQEVMNCRGHYWACMAAKDDGQFHEADRNEREAAASAHRVVQWFELALTAPSSPPYDGTARPSLILELKSA